MLQEALQAGARLWALDDLARIGRAHGGELVGEHQARLHEVQLVVELERVGMEQIAGQGEIAHRLPGEHALVGEVVDGEHAARLERRRPPRPAPLQDERCQGRLPVVRVHAVGQEVDLLGRLEGTGAEQGEPLVVVAVVLAALAVQLLSVVPGVGEEDVAQPFGRNMDVHVRAGVQAGKLHFHAAAGVAQAVRLRVDLDVLRQHDEDVVPASRQRPRQRADHVAQPARLDEGRRFRRDEEDLHEVRPPSAAGKPRPPPAAWD